jgi:phosphoribosylanthranilate isomerase
LTGLKICGITHRQDAIACADYGVDYLGFNFYTASPRFIAVDKACAIIQDLPTTTKSVAIVVRSTLIDVLEMITKSQVDMVQIHDPQDFSDFSEIPVPVISAKRIGESISGTIEFNGAEMILFDTLTPGKFGGSGKVFNWSLVPDNIPRDRLILAGGITPENVQIALDQVNPAVIDVASGAEYSPGIKDLTKVKRLLDVIKNR